MLARPRFTCLGSALSTNRSPLGDVTELYRPMSAAHVTQQPTGRVKCRRVVLPFRSAPPFTSGISPYPGVTFRIKLIPRLTTNVITIPLSTSLPVSVTWNKIFRRNNTQHLTPGLPGQTLDSASPTFCHVPSLSHGSPVRGVAGFPRGPGVIVYDCARARAQNPLLALATIFIS